MRAGSSITALSPRTVSVEGRSACRNSSDGYTSRFIPSGALSTMKASGSNDLTALRIKEVRKFFRSSKSIGILLGSYTRLATFTAEGNFTRSMPKDMRKALDTVEPVRIKMLVPVSASTKASASASVRRRWPSPYESCEYIRIFMLPFLLGIGVPCSCFHSACGRGTLRVRARPREPREGLGHQQDFDGSRGLSRNLRSWWPTFCAAITTYFTKRILGHSRHHLLPPCLPRKPGEQHLCPARPDQRSRE